MNYQRLLDALEAHTTALGYHPTTAENLHNTLRHEGFPIAIISYPQLTSIEGLKDVEKSFSVEVKLLKENEVTPLVRAEAYSLLVTDAENLARALAEEGEVREVTIEEVSPVERMLTIAGDVAITLKMKLKTIECC